MSERPIGPAQKPWRPWYESVLEPGVVVKGRFLLEKGLHHGNLGIVFKARDLRAGARPELVAMEFLDPAFVARPDVLDALQNAVRTARALAHPNIRAVYEFDRDGDLAYICSELLDGETLDSLLLKSNGLPFADAWPIIRGVGTALAHAHEHGIIHRDLQPHEVLITTDQRLKVLDFGLTDAVRSVDGGLCARRPRFASPEMFDGLPPDPRDDVYALAFMSYALLAGRYPFDKHAHRARVLRLSPPRIPALSTRRMRALTRGLALELDKRTPSANEFLAELEAKPSWRRWLRLRE
jgi:eukaryotic-like serine/threonine-protein kinase